MGVIDPVLAGEVGGQAPLPELLPAHVALHLAALSVRLVESVQAGQVGVLGQASADPARKENHHLGLGLVGGQADAVKEVD